MNWPLGILWSLPRREGFQRSRGRRWSGGRSDVVGRRVQIDGLVSRRLQVTAASLDPLRVVYQRQQPHASFWKLFRPVTLPQLHHYFLKRLVTNICWQSFSEKKINKLSIDAFELGQNHCINFTTVHFNSLMTNNILVLFRRELLIQEYKMRKTLPWIYQLFKRLTTYLCLDIFRITKLSIHGYQ